ncbi:MAG: cupin domain-containing protein [Acidiferrobacterales bacterium]
MTKILVEHDPSPMKLEVMGVEGWPVWSKEVSIFSCSYDQTETCYLLEGDVIVTPEQGDPVRIRAGDLVTFLSDLSCVWDIRSAVRKHYRLG